MYHSKRTLSNARLTTRFLWNCAGSSSQLMARSPHDHAMHASIGALILLMSLFSMLSAGYAASIVVGDDQLMLSEAVAVEGIWIAMFVGVLWGLSNYHLNRVFVCSLDKTASRTKQIQQLAPRLALATVVAFIISVPLELRVFEDDIKREIARTSSLSEAETLDSNIEDIEAEIEESANRLKQNRSQLAQIQLGNWPQIERIEAIIDRQLSKVSDFNDEIDKITPEIIRETRESCGPKCEEFKALRRKYVEDRDFIQRSIAANEDQIRHTEAQKKKEIEELTKKVSSLREKRDALRTGKFEELGLFAEQSSLLDRIYSWQRLGTKDGDKVDRIADITFFALFFVFFFLEAGPLIAKVLARPGSYDIQLRYELSALEADPTRGQS